MHLLGYVNRFDVCVPHKLSEKTLLEHIYACTSLLKHNEYILLLKQIMTGGKLRSGYFTNCGMEEVMGQVK